MLVKPPFFLDRHGVNHATILPTYNRKSYLKIRNLVSKILSVSASERDFSQGEASQKCNIPLPQKPGWLAFHWDFLPILWGKQVEGPVFMTLAPLWFVGLQDFTNSVAVTLDRKEETPFLPLLFSCLFNFHNAFVKGGSTWHFIAHTTQGVMAFRTEMWQAFSHLSNKTGKKRVEERGCCTVRYEHNKARLSRQVSF